MDNRILICAPIGQDAHLTARVLASAGINSTICKTLTDLMHELDSGAAALLLLEEVITSFDARPLMAYMALQPTWSDLPVLLMTHSGADSVVVQRAFETMGNVTILERPVRTIAVIAAARSAIRARQRQYQVRVADKRKDEFLATLAHELRNPLTPIRTSMVILQHRYPDAESITRVRNVVDRQVTHLTRLVDDLLDIARITTGKVTLKKDRITLRSVVTHALEISSSAIDSKKHQLDVFQPQEDVVLYADHARVVQSVANLLVNAAKFTPGQGHIVLRVQVHADTVQFSVQDNGAGLEPASMATIFDLFVQTLVPGEAPVGLGIGLSLARQFAEMHSGKIHAKSEGLGKGSEFILDLPVVVAGDTPYGAAPQVASGLEKQTSDAAASRKILVVDDNIDAADSLEVLLSLDGFEVTTAYDGNAAVAAAERTHPDVVVMDIGMPGINGYEAARRIRQLPPAKDMMLIALTGWGQAADRERVRQAGFDHHLVKPVDYDLLMKCIQGTM